ncbi:MAG: putative membrane protein YdjX (TVP38/TMEM64 family) [Francisella sp.]|jgi:uncharacterized membrane protein YdjX (TVP38/TMEM64 family)
MGLILFFVFDGLKYINLDKISSTYNLIDTYVSLHAYTAVFIYICIYVTAVFFSVPIKPFLKIIGGLLFGLWIGFIAALISATFGAMLVFLCVKYSWGEASTEGKITYISKFKSLVQENPITILLVSRLLPIPFFVPNILAGILKVKNSVFFFTTLIGIIPVTFVYVWIGTRVNGALVADDVYKLVDGKLMFAFVFLVVLAMVPIFIKKFRINKSTKIISSL